MTANTRVLCGVRDRTRVVLAYSSPRGTLERLPMARTRQTKPKDGVAATDSERPGDAPLTQDQSIDALAGLESGTKIMVRRFHPSYAKGFCTHIDVPDGGGDELIPEIQRSFGGGTYSLQVKQRSTDGRWKFAGKGILIDIAGEPTHMGRKYLTGGRLEPEQNPQPQTVAAPTPVVVHAPPPRTDAMQQQLLGLFSDMLQKGGGGNTDMAKLFEVMLASQQQHQPQTAAPVDEFGNFERMFSMVSKFSKMVGGTKASSDGDAPLGFLGGDSGALVEKALLAKFMGSEMMGGQPKSNAAPNMPPPPSPAHVWHPTAGWVHPSQLQPPAPVQAAPPQAPPKQAPPQETPAPAAGDEAGDPPLTASEMSVELEAMTDAERDKFLPTLLQHFGVPPEMLQNATDAIAKQAGAAQNVVDIGESYPVANTEG